MTTHAERIVVLCTANRCRSPMAEALLRRRLEGRGGLEVVSAGLFADGSPPPEMAVATMRQVGLDIEGRPSRPLAPGEAGRAALVVVMTRQHLVGVVEEDPEAWPRIFTLAGLVERASPRLEDETVADWAGRISDGRSRPSVLAAPPSEDVADPMGGSKGDFARARDRLDGLTARLADLLYPPGETGPAPIRPDAAPNRGRSGWLARRKFPGRF